MTLEQLDWLLEAIGADRQSLMWPVVTPGDVVALRSIARGRPERVAHHRQARLASEGLILVQDGRCEITMSGRIYLEGSND